MYLGGMDLAMFEALSERNIAKLKTYFEGGADIEQRDGTGMTALSVVAWRSGLGRDDDLKVASFLIEQGANPNTVDDYSRSALEGAMKSVKMTRLLLQAGADPHYRCQLGNISLHFAKNSETSAALIEAGVDVNARNRYGQTPIFETHSIEQARLLIKAGADTLHRDRDGLTSAEHLKRLGNRSSDLVDFLATETRHSVEVREAEELRQSLEANTAPAPAHYATDDEPWTPSAADACSFERQLAGVPEGEQIVREQAPVRARSLRL